MTYMPVARQRPLRKQQYDQPLISNYSVNNERCNVMAVVQQ
jgi:hypothetical protein